MPPHALCFTPRIALTGAIALVTIIIVIVVVIVVITTSHTATATVIHTATTTDHPPFTFTQATELGELRLEVLQCDGLEKTDMLTGTDAYVVLLCEVRRSWLSGHDAGWPATRSAREPTRFCSEGGLHAWPGAHVATDACVLCAPLCLNVRPSALSLSSRPCCRRGSSPALAPFGTPRSRSGHRTHRAHSRCPFHIRVPTFALAFSTTTAARRSMRTTISGEIFHQVIMVSSRTVTIRRRRNHTIGPHHPQGEGGRGGVFVLCAIVTTLYCRRVVIP